MKWIPSTPESFHSTLFITAIILISALFSGCIDIGEEDDGKVRIVVSILPQKQFVERVGGENVKVTVMVTEGQDPHGYEPLPSQMKEVAKADMYFKVGSGVEFEKVWMDTIEEQNGDMVIVDGSENIALIGFDEDDHDHGNGSRSSGNDENDEGASASEEEPASGGSRGEEEDHEHEQDETDPHIWLSPGNARIMVENLLDGLRTIDPDNAETYRTNANTYIAELNATDLELETLLEPYHGRKFLVYHPSFGYLAHEYDLIQIAIENEGKEPTPAGIQAIIDQAKEENITTVFVSPQFDESNAAIIADEIDGVVASIDPLGEDYLGNMEEIWMKLVEGFGKGA